MNTQNTAIAADEEIVQESTSLDLIDSSLAVGMARAEIDQQIATARRYPRSIKRAVTNILSLATLDEDTAAECIYSLPRSGKTISGASIRLAEIISQSWGNCRIATRVVHVDRVEKYIEAEGIYHDLETNMATLARVRRRISNKNGSLYNDDMIQQTGNAAASIARRNAILAGVPKGVWWKGYDAAVHVVRGEAKTLATRRAVAIEHFQHFGVTPEMIFAALNVEGADDIDLDDMVTLYGMASALKNGETTVEELFETKRPTKPKQDAGEALNNFAEDPKPKENQESEKASENAEHKPGAKPEEAATPSSEAAAYINTALKELPKFTDKTALERWWTSEALARSDFGLVGNAEAFQPLKKAYAERLNALAGESKMETI
ncbi:MAG: hypothetical protein P1U84_05000 [Parvibaculaceae bacterium]|nr:hypothetical protein [Parvibaculaceae bacterium]